MSPPWSPSGNANALQLRKFAIHEAYRKYLIVKYRPVTPLEELFTTLLYNKEEQTLRNDVQWRGQNVTSLNLNPGELIDNQAIVCAQDTYSVKPQRGRQILTEINGELWASARWLFFNLEYSIGFDSLTSWLSKYRGCVRRKSSPDGHVWLHNVKDFKEWRRKSIGLQVRQDVVKAKIREIRV